MPFLAMNKEELNGDRPDFVFVSGDAYVDHCSFGAAIITRVLESKGYLVAIIAQPNWRDCGDFKRFGKPRLGFLVSSGNIDSMVNHYTASKKRRSNDAYSPGGQSGMRPDRAVIVYCNRIREAYGDVPIIIGGIEASLRRFAHYDYWDNRVRRSILLDSRADLLSFGMGERSIVEIAEKLKDGVRVKEITDVDGTCYLSKGPVDGEFLPSFEEVREDKRKYAKMTAKCLDSNSALIQKHHDRFLVQNPPAKTLSREEMDATYALPYMRAYHPSYEKDGGVPAIVEVEFSLTSSRGCFGGCNFCSITHHQGRQVVSRSHESLIDEAERMIRSANFKGYIHDVGGPTANFRAEACDRSRPCMRKRCLYPEPCRNLKVDHRDYLELLRKLRRLSGVKKVFVRSGIRYDYMLADKSDAFFNELVEHHVSGQLKVAPEHASPGVLRYMGKPKFAVYKRFAEKFYKINERLSKKQFLVPYLMSSHPGSTLNDAILLAQYLIEHRLNAEQVQDFYPTPGTLSTCMYYTGIDPRDMSEVYVPKSYGEKAQQRALLQPRVPKNRKMVREVLVKAGREDLIGKFFGQRPKIVQTTKNNFNRRKKL